MQKSKKFVIGFVAVIVFIAMVTAGIVLSYTIPNKSQNETANAIVGSGLGWANSDTSSGIYYIRTSSDFSSFRTEVNTNGNKFAGCTVYLTASITINSYVPVGIDTTNYFSGTFDGQGFTLNISHTSNSSYVYWGIFGYSKGCTIKNVKCTSLSMTYSYNSSTTASRYFGYVLGYGQGNFTIQNCEAVVNRIYSSRTQYGSMHIGGLVGYISGTVNMTGNKVTTTYSSGNGDSIYAYSYSRLTTSMATAGGIAGYLNITGKSYFEDNTVNVNTGSIYAYGSYHSSSDKCGGGSGSQIGMLYASNSTYIELKNLNTQLNYQIKCSMPSGSYALTNGYGGMVGYLKNAKLTNSTITINASGATPGGCLVGNTEGTCTISNNKVSINTTSQSLSSGVVNSTSGTTNIYDNQVSINTENAITSSFNGIVGTTSGTTKIYGCTVNFNATKSVASTSTNINVCGIVGTNKGVLDISKCFVGVNAINAIYDTCYNPSSSFYGILGYVGGSSSDEGVDMTTTISKCVLSVTKINGVYIYRGTIAGISGNINTDTGYGDASLKISGCYVGGGGSMNIYSSYSSNKSYIAGIAYESSTSIFIDNCMCSLTLTTYVTSYNYAYGIGNTSLISNCIFTGTITSYNVEPVGVYATNCVAYCKYTHTVSKVQADGSTANVQETVTLHDVTATELSDRNYLGTLGFDLNLWRGVENGGMSLIIGILTDYDNRLSLTKFEYNFEEQIINLSFKTNGYQINLTNGQENVSLATSNSGTIGFADYTAQVVDGYVNITLNNCIMADYSFYVVNNVTTTNPNVSIFKTNYTGQEQGFTYEISAIYAGGYYPKISINSSPFVEISDKDKNEEVLGGCYYSCQFAMGVFNLQVSGIGASNIVLDAYAHTKDEVTDNKITTSVTSGTADVKVTYNENNGAEMLVTPGLGFYVYALVFGDCNVPIEYYQAQIMNAGSAKQIVYYAKESTNIFYVTFDGIYADMDVEVVLTTSAPTLKNPPSTSGGGVSVSGTVVSATVGGEARIVGNQIENGEETDKVTFVAVAYSGYRFAGWAYANDLETIINVNPTAQFTKTEVNGKILKAIFVSNGNDLSGTNSETNNSDSIL